VNRVLYQVPLLGNNLLLSYQFQIKIFHSIRKDTLNVSSSNSLQIYSSQEEKLININLNWFKISIQRRYIYDDIEKFKSNKIIAFWCIVCHQNQLYTWTLCYTFTLKFGTVALNRMFMHILGYPYPFLKNLIAILNKTMKLYKKLKSFSLVGN